MFDPVSCAQASWYLLQVEDFLTVHLCFCGVDAVYCYEIDRFVLHWISPIWQDIFQKLGDYHAYSSMFAKTFVSILDAAWVAYV